MKRNLLFKAIGILLLWLFAESHFNQLFAQGDVINGNKNMQVQFLRGYGRINLSEGTTEPTWLAMAANDTDNFAFLMPEVILSDKGDE